MIRLLSFESGAEQIKASVQRMQRIDKDNNGFAPLIQDVQIASIVGFFGDFLGIFWDSLRAGGQFAMSQKATGEVQLEKKKDFEGRFMKMNRVNKPLFGNYLLEKCLFKGDLWNLNQSENSQWRN